MGSLLLVINGWSKTSSAIHAGIPALPWLPYVKSKYSPKFFSPP